MKYIEKYKKSHVINCGYGKGYSVLEIIEKFQEVANKKFKIKFKKKEMCQNCCSNDKIIKYIKTKIKL